MEGPKEITVPEHKYNCCQHCKHFAKQEVFMIDTRTSEYEYLCGHLDVSHNKKVRPVLWTSRQLQQIKFKVRVETPEWCPYLDSNNKRKVLMEKYMNANE